MKIPSHKFSIGDIVLDRGDNQLVQVVGLEKMKNYYSILILTLGKNMNTGVGWGKVGEVRHESLLNFRYVKVGEKHNVTTK